MITASEGIRLAVGSLVLLAVTAIALRAGGVRLGAAPYWAVGRGALQLAAVGAALRGVLAAPPAAAAVIVIMLGTATWTATHRIHGLDHTARWVVAACVSATAVVLGTVFAIGVLAFQARYVIALGGIVIGATMTGATLTGRNFRTGLVSRREEVEAWLAIGATPRRAALEIARTAAGEALIPALDQTRTTGLVTLPGAFIGSLLGGASPVQAARFQLVVLVAIIAAQSIVGVVLIRGLGAPATIPVEIAAPPARERGEAAAGRRRGRSGAGEQRPGRPGG